MADLYETEKARVRDIIREFLANQEPLEMRATSAAEVFLRESIHFDGDMRDVGASEIGAMILSSSDEARRLILLAVLKKLNEAPLESSVWQPNIIGNVGFVHDYHWGFLINAILRSRPQVNEDFLSGILYGLSYLTNRFNSNFPENSYEFPFDNLIRFIDRHIPKDSLEDYMPAIMSLFESIKEGLRSDLEIYKGYGREESVLQSANPEKWFKKADRNAIKLIKGWLMK